MYYQYYARMHVRKRMNEEYARLVIFKTHRTLRRTYIHKVLNTAPHKHATHAMYAMRTRAHHPQNHTYNVSLSIHFAQVTDHVFIRCISQMMSHH